MFHDIAASHEGPKCSMTATCCMRGLRVGLNDKQASHEQEGQSLAGATAAAQPGSSAQAGAGLSSTLRPDAAEFVPSADKADPASPSAAASAQQNGVVRKRTSEAAGLQSHAGPETRSPKAQRSMNGHAGRSPAAEMRPLLVPNGQPVSPSQLGTKAAEEAAGLQKALSAQESGEITLS